MATEVSATESCFTKATETQITPHQMAMNTRVHLGTLSSRSHTDAIPREYPTYNEGHTPVAHRAILYKSIACSAFYSYSFETEVHPFFVFYINSTIPLLYNLWYHSTYSLGCFVARFVSSIIPLTILYDAFMEHAVKQIGTVTISRNASCFTGIICSI